MMLTARFQAARLQPAMRCSMQRRGALQVVAFKNGDEEQQQVQKQEMSKTKVTFQLPLHGEQQCGIRQLHRKPGLPAFGAFGGACQQQGWPAAGATARKPS